MQSDLEDPALVQYRPEFLRSRLNEIDAALVNKNFKEISDLGHSWKGFSAPFGFKDLEIIAKELEKNALKKDLENCLLKLQEAQNFCSSELKKLESQ